LETHKNKILERKTIIFTDKSLPEMTLYTIMRFDPGDPDIIQVQTYNFYFICKAKQMHL